MPYSFTKIEKDKSFTIQYGFAFLIGFYFFTVWFIGLLFKNYKAFESRFETSQPDIPFEFFSLFGTLSILSVAVIIAVLHWMFTVNGLVERISSLLRAREINPDDPQERMLANIVEEVSVATGGMKIRPVVIDSLALNACAYADGDSTPVIAVTRGLINKLSRAQLEAVVGHEAAHVVSEDCEGTTIISSMFEIFSAFLTGIKYVLYGLGEVMPRRHHRRSYGNVGRDGEGVGRATGSLARLGPAIIFIMIVVAFIWLANVLARFMRMFISREREYRADAVAVRLTRNPLALAEALYIIGHRRRKLSDIGDSMETMFIMNPRVSLLDERESFFADLFSTHPPIDDRIKILLDMAHENTAALQSAYQDSLKRSKAAEEEMAREAARRQEKRGKWFIQDQSKQWIGPHTIEELARMEWVKPQMLVKNAEANWMLPLMGIGLYTDVKSKLVKGKLNVSKVCPSCSGELLEAEYERLTILRCANCHGVLLNENQMGMIFQRRDKIFDQRIKRLAQAAQCERLMAPNEHLNVCQSDRKYKCEKCKINPRPMLKKLFNRYYHVEIDKCMECGVIWFDKDELEILQCLYEFNEDKNSQMKTS